MPRLAPSLLRHARHEHSLLPYLLRVCRELPSARNELRWLTEHVETRYPSLGTSDEVGERLKRLCIDRARGKPLQYILGSQPFGDLDIRCSPGVLIPRPETEAYTVQVTNTLIQRCANNRPLRILDLCTGTGCIALLLHSLLSPHFSDLTILGIDISPQAVSLAEQNLSSSTSRNRLPRSAWAQVRFSQADVFTEVPKGKWDVVISNPPYISPRDFDRSTGRSVRRWEPKQALVPWPARKASNVEEPCEIMGDTFYPRLLEIARQAGTQFLVMEVADMEQAKRIMLQAIRTEQWATHEIWRDWPECPPSRSAESSTFEGTHVAVIGEGHGRAVVLSR